MRLQRAIGGWATPLVLLLMTGARSVSAAGLLDQDSVFGWRQGWVESPQWGGRLGYINGQGDLKVRLRSHPAGAWVTVARQVRSFQLLDWSVAVLSNDGTLFTAEGALNTPLDAVAENVCAFQKTLTRLGILQCDGTLLVKETVSSPPRAVAAGIEAFQILDDRVALRGADGSLWVQEGGVAANFHKLADRVSSFQLERGWIAYLEPRAAAGGTAAAARLMIAEGSLFLGSAVTPREVARDVMDFEMEVRVDADASFGKTLYLAVLSREGVLKIGVGASLPAEIKEFDRGAFCRLGWAGERLAYLGADGLKVAHFGAGVWPGSLDSLPGTISSFRMTPEGTLLFDGVRGSSNLVDWRQASEDAVPAAQTGEDGESTSLVMDSSAELAVDAASGDAPGAVESSSVRPHFMRRPVQAEVSSTASRAFPVRLFSNAPRARAVDASDRPVSSDAAGASKAAPDASVATIAAFVSPLSQATAVPLYQLYYSGTTDHFYTTSASDRDFAKSLGFADQGVAAYVEPTQIAGTLPFWRFYSGAQTDHFYTTSVAEYNYVVANGFSYESVEGYLYSTQAAGTVPLHRLSWWNPSNNDLDHFYTTSEDAKNSVLAQGWTYDGVAGYVWPNAAPPPGPPNAAVFVSQSVPASMTLGQSYPVSVTVRNTGTNSWSPGAAYRLGSQNPQDNMTWGVGRVAVPFNVAPEATVTFSFTVTPSSTGSLNFQWRMVQDGVEWFGDFSPNVPVSVSAPPSAGTPLYRWYASSTTDHFYSLTNYGTTLLGFSQQGIAAYLAPAPGPSVLAFRRFYSGSRSEHFYTTDADEAAYVVNTLGFMDEGIEGYLFTTPQAGTVPFYRLSWCGSGGDCDHIYTAWASEKDQVVTLGWTYDGVAGYVGAPPGSPPPPPGLPNAAAFVSQNVPTTMVLGQPTPVSITMRNTGTQTWTAAASYRLSSQNPVNTMVWGFTRVELPNDVPSGATVTFSFSVVPAAVGTMNFQWLMVQDGVEWFGDRTPNVAVAVSSAQSDNAAFVSQSVPGLMTAGLPSSVSMTLRNTGSTTWSAAAGYQLSSQNPQDNTQWGTARVNLPGDVPPNETITFSFAATPAAAGRIPFQWRMVRGSGPFGAATQNVLVVVDKNPHLIIGATPYADNYINNFNSLQGSVPPQTSVRWKPYTGNECPTPFLTTSACNPGIPAWARDNRPNPIINPCLAPLMVTENFLAPHARRNIGPDINGVTWTPVGKSTYGPINWFPCDVAVLQATGFCHAPTKLLFWLVEADPVLAVGSGTYCPTDRKSTTRYSQGNLSREILPGEVTPDSYAMVPDWAPNFAQGGVQANPWRAYVPAGHKVVANDQIAGKGDIFWINVPPTGTSIPVLGATLFGGGGSGPQCFADECVPINDRSMAQKLNGVWMITVTGYMTGNDSIFRNTSDALTDLSSLSGNAVSNPTVEAIQNWMVQNNVLNPVFLGHSLGAMDLTVLYQRGFGSQLILFSAPWVLPVSSLQGSSSEIVPGGPRPVLVYSGTNDPISNMLPAFSGCGNYTDSCRRNNGVNLISVDTGAGFLTGNNPHDRCLYQAFYYGGGQCPW